jgi:hypothetical protein
MVAMTSKMSFVVVIVAGSTIPDHEEMFKVQEKVKELIQYIKKFDTASECEAFVRSIRSEHIILIVTPDMINMIFALNIHQIRHVQSIFLFDPQITMTSQQVFELKESSYKVCIMFVFVIL